MMIGVPSCKPVIRDRYDTRNWTRVLKWQWWFGSSFLGFRGSMRWMVRDLDPTLPDFTLLVGCSDILRWKDLEGLGLVSRWGRVDMQCPFAAGEAGKRSDLNLRYIFFFCPPVCQWPRIWALFWYSCCLVSLSNFSPLASVLSSVMWWRSALQRQYVETVSLQYSHFSVEILPFQKWACPVG